MSKNNYTTKRNSKSRSKSNKSQSKRRTGANNFMAGGVDSYDDIKSNDIAWYDKATYLYSEATRVPFDVIAGVPYNFGNDGRTIRKPASAPGATYEVEGESVPGMMAINYYPHLGYSDNINSPVNRAFTTMYGDLQSKTTGVLPFQQADLALFVTSTSSIAGLIGHAKRILEVAGLYSPLNYHYPIDLMTMLLGSESEALEVARNRDHYRSQLNNLIFQFNTLKIPSFVDTFKRQYSIAHNIFADEDDVQAQLFAFIPIGYYRYIDTEMKIKMEVLPRPEAKPISYTTILEAIQTALDAWRQSSDLPLINGALLRAYPDNQFVKIDMLNIDSVLTPVCDRNILWQINNARTVHVDPETLDVTQDAVGNFLECKPKIKITNNTRGTINRSWVYLNAYDFNESPEFIMEATRLIPYIEAEVVGDPATSTEAILKTACTELIVNFVIYTRKLIGGVSSLTNYSLTSNLYPAHMKEFDRVLGLNKWRNAPRVSVWCVEETATSFIGESGDLSHYTRLSQSQLDSLHEAALQSLYWIDTMSMRV